MQRWWNIYYAAENNRIRRKKQIESSVQLELMASEETLSTHYLNTTGG